MANSMVVAVSSLFVLSVLFSNGDAASPNDVVSTICPKTRNPSFCSDVLKSAGTSDLKELATFTLNLAHDKAAESRALAQSLASKAADPKLNDRYATCAELYDNAADGIEDGKKYLGEGDYNGVNIKASAAMTEAGDCLDSFTQPPEDPSALPGNGKAVEDICSIILVIANLLIGSV
ncbi:pectinesterase inhibitor-like [Cucurbita pepo subsp. pepo]|uniref:pectinesterase inhibitor-like n=1 Tax=Cucurbita pepo subsp. pepo TaxID=3664 RepID=UPI000C9D481B|nr:pectinesterase inhibitor-like [Cucurbita pepo subsp. pepo]